MNNKTTALFVLFWVVLATIPCVVYLAVSLDVLLEISQAILQVDYSLGDD